ncbi:MAG: CDP-2,3-bis-(O-geranylgeranyl)-sn-glycerol synthase [Candidatus Bathyarchaeia archaeon]
MYWDWTAAIYSVTAFLPAYVANAVPTVLGGGAPVDLGHDFPDGRRVFGKNKTIRGLISGLTAGTLTGLIQNAVFTGFTLSLGALLGDLMGSFIKRRLGIPPGKPLPILDQLSFVAGAFLLSALFSSFDIVVAYYVVILTPVFHVATNLLAYLLKIKPVPW